MPARKKWKAHPVPNAWILFLCLPKYRRKDLWELISGGMCLINPGKEGFRNRKRGESIRD